jgi:hypothetical protein
MKVDEALMQRMRISCRRHNIPGIHLIRAALKLFELAHVRADGEKDGTSAGKARQCLSLTPRLKALSCILCCDWLLYGSKDAFELLIDVCYGRSDGWTSRRCLGRDKKACMSDAGVP